MILIASIILDQLEENIESFPLIQYKSANQYLRYNLGYKKIQSIRHKQVSLTRQLMRHVIIKVNMLNKV